MMSTVKITSGSEHLSSGRPGTDELGKGRAKAVATMLFGLVVVVNAHFMPWVVAKPGQDVIDRLLGGAPTAEVKTYALTDLPGIQAFLYAGWVLLLSLLVAAWVRPEWRRDVRIGARLLMLALMLALTMFAPGAAIDVSGFPIGDGPSTDFLAGTYLALFGTMLLAIGASALPASPQSSAPPTPAPVRPTPDAEAVGAGSSAPAAPITPFPALMLGQSWSARPARVPWWRQPWPVTGVVVGTLTVAILVGTFAWQATHRPANRHRDLAALLVASPADSTPAQPAAADDRVNTSRLLPLTDFRALMLAEQLRDDVQHSAGTAWTRPDHALVQVTLLQFDSPLVADQFRRSYVDIEGAVRSTINGVDLPDVPGAVVFSGDEQGRVEVNAIAHRDDVVVLVSANGGPSDINATVNALVREQYDRL
ncbi:hypothetical protein GCM10023176_38050 [Micromonospora coerulea]|uniref:Uncharacterized protein n=1 Tax=Micromonospora coerulea TaxID=47856 RepID=A0ABP8SPJ8_9ACTN